MKIKRIIVPREEIADCNMRQTAIVVIGERTPGPLTYRVIINDFKDRTEAYSYCQENKIKNCTYDKEGYKVAVTVKLLALNTALVRYDNLPGKEGENKTLEIWKIVE